MDVTLCICVCVRAILCWWFSHTGKINKLMNIRHVCLPKYWCTLRHSLVMTWHWWFVWVVHVSYCRTERSLWFLSSWDNIWQLCHQHDTWVIGLIPTSLELFSCRNNFSPGECFGIISYLISVYTYTLENTYHATFAYAVHEIKSIIPQVQSFPCSRKGRNVAFSAFIFQTCKLSAPMGSHTDVEAGFCSFFKVLSCSPHCLFSLLSLCLDHTPCSVSVTPSPLLHFLLVPCVSMNSP